MIEFIFQTSIITNYIQSYIIGTYFTPATLTGVALPIGGAGTLAYFFSKTIGKILLGLAIIILILAAIALYYGIT